MASRSKAAARCSNSCGPNVAPCARCTSRTRSPKTPAWGRSSSSRRARCASSRPSKSSRSRAATCIRASSRLAAPLRGADLDDLCAEPDAFLVVVDGVTDPRNLGAIMRSADTAGATGIVVPRHRAAHVTPSVAKAAAGAIEHLPIAVVGGIPNALERMQRAEVWTVGLDERGKTSLYDLDLGRPTPRARARRGRKGPRPPHAGAVRHARAHPDVRARAVAQRVRGGDARVSRSRAPAPQVTARYVGFSQTEMWLRLSLVKGARCQSLQRSRNVIPASRAMRSSSDGHRYRCGDENGRELTVDHPEVV